MTARRFTMAFVCSLVAFSSLAIAGPAGAAVSKLNARGHVSCTMRGTIRYSPTLTDSGESVSATVKAALSCSVGETGSSLVTVQSGKLKGSSAFYIGSCSFTNPSSLSARVTWKAAGGKVNPTDIVLSPPSSASGSPASYTRGLATGSYANELPQARFVWASSCGGKGLKKSSFTGTLDIATSCNPPIRTEVSPVQVHDPSRADDGYVWWVVLPVCPFTAATHPTGTITWGYADPRNAPACSGATNAPLADSGVTQVNSLIAGAPVNTATPLWGVNTGINLQGGVSCNGLGNAHFWLRYSGDSTYAPYVYDAGF
jgi:hypothetical protein